MTVTAQAIPMLSDNYAWLLIDSATGKTGIVDPAEAAPAIAVLERLGLGLDFIFLTHHHDDHIGGVAGLVDMYHPTIVGNQADAHRLPPLDIPVHEGSLVEFGNARLRVIETPGHTLGHISYYIADGNILLPGDTLFSLGCGRLFEGSAEQMFNSIAKYGDLPDETQVCAGHEYTSSNARFALTVEPQNEALRRRAVQVQVMRGQGLPTLPVSLGLERATNPFIRARDAQSFARIRTAKDNA
ncbi:MAG: hydroxyacylglutathione hydrolase [Rhodospirillales bacterium]|nr:hydroxyacylglutathione hydrolase [Rhodospirillales bacterium]MDE2390251.1 hydroxyacylglutathione hydrolase [Rhodospirillales bacterium]MDE2459331.1 hydroxyacylglutathione hydrolase [Rhodospirillales bacterium]